MTTVSARLNINTSTVIYGRLRLAQLATISEEEFGRDTGELEKSRLFKLLMTAGIIRLSEFPRARFAAKQFAGYGVKLSTGSGLPELVDGNSDLVRIIRRIGQKKFEACFLKSEASDIKTAKACGLTLNETRRVKELVDTVFIQTEFELTSAEPAAPPVQVYSSVAGIMVENNKPVLAFFNREIWKGQYSVNKNRLAEYLSAIPPAEARKAKTLVGQLEFLERRKTTLYRLLELLLESQKDYLVCGKPEKRTPLTQRQVAKQVEVDPSVLNRLLSNKSVQMPWGLEVPLSALIPSAKQINRGLLYELLSANPGLSDEKLRRLMEAEHGVKLSRRSISQYRSELGLS
ncbi:MAG: hypothetical protein ABIG11_06205 [bacterium]